MSKEVKRYEVTILLDASSSYTVEADSVEAAEHAAWEAHDEAGPSLCHQCSGPMDLGDAYGMLIYCEGKEVADTTHDAREIADLRAERDALFAERDVLVEALGSMTCAYRMAIQAGHARITALGGDCDDVERMLADFPDYGKAVELYKSHRAALQGEQP